MMDATSEAPARRPWGWSAASALLALVVVFGGFVLTDDAWPFAPLRMFSVGNNPNGVVRAMRLQGDTADRHLILYAGHFGLRRAELEEQTPHDRRVPDAKLAALVEVYNERHPDEPLLHLQVVVNRTQMRNGEPASEPVPTIIGDWASPEWTGPRADVDLPAAPPWPGYGK